MKISMKNYLYTTLIIVALLVSCAAKMNAGSFDRLMQNYGANYKKVDIGSAQELTLQLINNASEYESEGVKGIEYDWVYLCSYSRLYHIHTKIGNRLASQADLIKIEKIYKGSGYSADQIKTKIPKLLDFVKKMDIKNSVNWLKE